MSPSSGTFTVHGLPFCDYLFILSQRDATAHACMAYTLLLTSLKLFLNGKIFHVRYSTSFILDIFGILMTVCCSFNCDGDEMSLRFLFGFGVGY